MKTIFRIVLGVGELIAAVVFLTHDASDIQLGFGLVFLFLAVSAFISVL